MTAYFAFATASKMKQFSATFKTWI